MAVGVFEVAVGAFVVADGAIVVTVGAIVAVVGALVVTGGAGVRVVAPTVGVLPGCAVVVCVVVTAAVDVRLVAAEAMPVEPDVPACDNAMRIEADNTGGSQVAAERAAMSAITIKKAMMDSADFFFWDRLRLVMLIRLSKWYV